MEPDELLSVIGHELGHIRLRHVTWLTFTNPRYQALRMPLLSELLQPIFNNWHLRSEYSADRAGLIAANNDSAAVMAEVRLLVEGAVPKDFNCEKFLEEVLKEEDKLGDTVLQLLLDTHPHGRRRIRQIMAYSRSDEFNSIRSQYLTPTADAPLSA